MVKTAKKTTRTVAESLGDELQNNKQKSINRLKFKISQQHLKRELEFVRGSVEKTSSIPALQNLLIETSDDNLIRITGTDLDLTMRCELSADIKNSGSICVPAQRLYDIIRYFPEAEVEFKQEANDWVEISCLKAKFNIYGSARDSFPEVPKFKDAPMHLPAKVFRDFISRTSFAITQEQASRFMLSGAKFIICKGIVKMIATDGYRLAYTETKSPIEGCIDQIIPKKALLELAKLSREAEEIFFGEDPNHLMFKTGNRFFITRKLAGTFPNYEMVFPQDADKTASFDAKEIKDAVRRVSLMSDDSYKTLRLSFKSGKIHLSAQSVEDGKSAETISAEYSGEDIEIRLNAKYFYEFLSSVDEEVFPGGRVSIKFKNAGSHVEFASPDNSLRHVICLLRI